MTFDQVRRLAPALPETVEVISYGTPAFKSGKKLLVRLREEGDVLVRLPAVSEDELADLLSDAWRLTATPRMQLIYPDMAAG
jgi:hypothetical protein